MLRVLFRLFLVIAVIVGIMAVIGSFLPHDYRVEARCVIDAKNSEVFPYINDLSRWPEWTNWSPKQNPHLKVELGKITAGEGASQTWSDPRGTGKLWIREVVNGQTVFYEYEFGNFPRSRNRVEIFPSNDGIEVIWISTGTLPSGPFYGFFRSFFCEGLRREYDSCLKRLKTLAEKEEPTPEKPVDVEDAVSDPKIDFEPVSIILRT